MKRYALLGLVVSLVLLLGWGTAWAETPSSTTPESLWAEISTLNKSFEIYQAYKPDGKEKAAKLFSLALQFRKDYPDHPLQKRLKNILAKCVTINYMETSLEIDSTTEAICNELMKDNTVYPADAMQLWSAYQNRLITQYYQSNNTDVLISIESTARRFISMYPDYSKKEILLHEYASMMENGNPKLAASLYAECTGSKDSFIQKQSTGYLTRSAAMGKPIRIQFTDIYGKKVDTAKLKGKVILIDFWATWCGPCVGEIPQMLDIYKRYHSKGLEIISISLDDNKDELTSFVKEKNIPWPQYFDGKGWENDISIHYGIRSVPTLFLIDQKGILVTDQARNMLEFCIVNLLSGKPFNSQSDVTPFYFKNPKEASTYYEKFKKSFSLKEGEVIKFLPNKKHYQEKIAFAATNKYPNPQNYTQCGVWIYDTAYVHPRIFGSRNISLYYIFHALNINRKQFSIDSISNKLTLAGDLVIRKNTTLTDLQKPLEKILRQQLKEKISVRLVEKEQTCLVLKGQYKYTPDESITDNKSFTKDSQIIYLTKTDKKRSFAGGSFNDLLNAISYNSPVIIVNDATGTPADSLLFESLDFRAEKDPKVMLEYAAQQSGLTVQSEVRKLPYMIIEMEK